MSYKARFALCAMTALLVALTFTAQALNAAPPNCVAPTVKTVTYKVEGIPDISVTTPVTFQGCPTDGCCNTITIAGLPAGFTVLGNLISSYVFTTMCKNGQPAYPPQGRQTLENQIINVMSTGAPITLKICYPPVQNWPSFESHVDVQLRVLNLAGAQVGIIGPGSDWDTYCTTVGCTPGKWKNWTGLGPGNQTNLWPPPYVPGLTTYASAFGKNYSTNPNLTMLQALELGGSGEAGMARHCTAALLNAKWGELRNPQWLGNVCQTFADGTPDVITVINWVQAAYNGTRTFNSAMNLCAAMNESLCAIDGVWMNTNTGQSACQPGNIPCNQP